MSNTDKVPEDERAVALLGQRVRARCEVPISDAWQKSPQPAALLSHSNVDDAERRLIHYGIPDAFDTYSDLYTTLSVKHLGTISAISEGNPWNLQIIDVRCKDPVTGNDIYVRGDLAKWELVSPLELLALEAEDNG